MNADKNEVNWVALCLKMLHTLLCIRLSSLTDTVVFLELLSLEKQVEIVTLNEIFQLDRPQKLGIQL